MLSRRSFVASSLAASGLICASELPAKPGKTEVLVVGAGAGGAAISWRLASLGLGPKATEGMQRKNLQGEGGVDEEGAEGLPTSMCRRTTTTSGEATGDQERRMDLFAAGKGDEA